MRDRASPACFAEFRFDPETLELSRGDAIVPLTGLPLRLLEILLESEGRVVTRVEFKRRLWPHAERIDTERRLNTAMRALREALDDEAGEPRCIETVRRRGYRWIADAPVAPSTRAGRSWIPAALALSLTLFLGGSRLEPDFDRGTAALAGADGGSARLLEAQLAVRDWQSRPGPESLARARFAVAAAGQGPGRAGIVDVLAAEIALGADWNWHEAERLYRRAIDRDSGNIGARRGLAWLRVNSGRPDLAVAEVERLVADAPMTDAWRADLGWLLIRAGRGDLALPMCAAGGTRELNLLACRHTALAKAGRIGEARNVAAELMRLAAADPDLVARVRRIPAEQGYRLYLEWRIEAFLPGDGHWFQRAQLQAEAGRMGEALDSLERAIASRDPLAVKIASTAAFRNLAGEPRFQALLGAVHRRA